MNRNALYLAIFGILCVLAGVVVGAGVTNKVALPGGGPGRMDFIQKAERFMGHKPRGFGRMRGGGGLAEMLTVRLDLSAGQEVKVREILDRARQEIDEIGKNIRSAINGVKEKSDKQIMGILTPQQQEKFKALLKEFKGRCGSPKEPRAGHRHGPMEEYGPRPDQEQPALP